MLGDFILWLRKVIKQNTCIHDYGDDYEVIHCGRQLFRVYDCIKCDRSKSEEI